MKKKWLVAICFMKKERLLTVKSYKVSYDIDVADVIVPENTLFYFFNNNEEFVPNVEVIQWKLSEAIIGTWITSNLISDNKVYCYGTIKENSLILEDSEEIIELKDVVSVLKEQGILIEEV